MVHDDRLFAGWTTDGPALASLPGVVGSLLQGPLGDGQALYAHPKAGVVHHLEHVPHALVLLAHQVAHGAVACVSVREHARRAGMQAQLVLDRHAGVVVALPQTPVVAD